MEVAGSVVIQIGGDLSSFESALAKAQSLAASFDAKVTAQLSGAGLSAGLAKISGLIEQTNSMLSKLTSSSSSASAGLAKIDAATQPVAASLQKVTAASITANAELSKLGAGGSSAALSGGTISAKAFAQALEQTGGNLARISPEMLGLAQAEQVVTQATQAATTSFKGFTQAEIDAFRSQQAGQNFSRDLNERFGLLNATTKSARDSATAFRDLGLVEAAATTATKGHAASLLAHGAAASLDTAQWMALTHAARGFTEQVAMGVNPVRALMSEMSHLSFVASGPGGISGAFQAVGSTIASAATSFGAFITGGTLAGTAVAGLGVAALGAVAGIFAIKNAAEEAEKRSVTWGETFTAAFEVIKEGALGTAASAVWSPIEYALSHLGSAAVDIAELILNSFTASYHDITFIWDQFPNMLGNVFVTAANFGIDALNTLVKKTSDAIDSISSALNKFGANIPLLMAPKDSIAQIANPYADAFAKANAENIARTQADMQAHPLRDFASDVIDRIKTNNALQGLDALGNIDFSKSINGANALGTSIGGVGKAANGATVEIGGMQQQAINVTKLFQDAKLSQLMGIAQANNDLLKNQILLKTNQNILDQISKTPVSDVFGKFFKGDDGEQVISDAASAIDKVFKAFDTGNQTMRGVSDTIESVRASLKSMDGADALAVDAWINKIVNGELEVRRLTSLTDDLHKSIASLPDKTITITVRTQTIGSGTQSLYSVPNDTGSYSDVGVTRYGGVPGQQSGPSITANQVPSSYTGSESAGYGSSYGGSGSSTVNVIRFGGTRATGGPLTANLAYLVGEQGPELVIPSAAASVVPNAQTTMFGQALAGTGTNAAALPANDNQDQFTTILQGIQANTLKTANLLDTINSTIKSNGSLLSGSSSSSSSSSSSTDQSAWQSAFSSAYKTAQSNYYAAKATFGGDGGVLYPELAASPFDIAMNAASMATGRGGTPSVGSAGATSYEKSLLATQQMLQSIAAQNIKSGGLGFASGGFIAPGDTQEVRFFKDPSEAVAILTPSQMKAMQGANQNQQTTTPADQRPINIYQTHNWNGNAPPSQASQNELRRQTALAVRDAMRAYSGR